MAKQAPVRPGEESEIGRALVGKEETVAGDDGDQTDNEGMNARGDRQRRKRNGDQRGPPPAT